MALRNRKDILKLTLVLIIVPNQGREEVVGGVQGAHG
jgi:hypothetical protein